MLFTSSLTNSLSPWLQKYQMATPPCFIKDIHKNILQTFLLLKYNLIGNKIRFSESNTSVATTLPKVFSSSRVSTHFCKDFTEIYLVILISGGKISYNKHWCMVNRKRVLFYMFTLSEVSQWNPWAIMKTSNSDEFKAQCLTGRKQPSFTNNLSL